MNYFKNENGDVFAYDDGQVSMGYGSSMIPMTQKEVDDHINPSPTYQSELADLNAAWQLKVDSYNRSFALAALSDGASEESKKAAIRAAYEADKVQNTADRAELKAKYGIGGV